MAEEENDMDARIRRMIKKYTPEKDDEAVEQLLSKYVGNEAKLLAAYRSKYGPEPTEIDVADIEDIQRRIRAMMKHYMKAETDATIEKKLTGFQGKERTVLKNMIRKLGKEPVSEQDVRRRKRAQSVAPRAKPMAATALERIPSPLKKFAKHAIVVRRVDKVNHDKTTTRPRVLVLTPYGIFLCALEGDVKRFVLCASVKAIRCTQSPAGAVQASIVSVGQADLVIALTPFTVNTSNDPNALLKLIAQAVVAASTPGTKSVPSLLQNMPWSTFIEATTYQQPEEKGKEKLKPYGTVAEEYEGLLTADEPPPVRRGPPPPPPGLADMTPLASPKLPAPAAATLGEAENTPPEPEVPATATPEKRSATEAMQPVASTPTVEPSVITAPTAPADTSGVEGEPAEARPTPSPQATVPGPQSGGGGGESVPPSRHQSMVQHGTLNASTGSHQPSASAGSGTHSVEPATSIWKPARSTTAESSSEGVPHAAADRVDHNHHHPAGDAAAPSHQPPVSPFMHADVVRSSSSVASAGHSAHSPHFAEYSPERLRTGSGGPVGPAMHAESLPRQHTAAARIPVDEASPARSVASATLSSLLTPHRSAGRRQHPDFGPVSAAGRHLRSASPVSSVEAVRLKASASPALMFRQRLKPLTFAAWPSQRGDALRSHLVRALRDADALDRVDFDLPARFWRDAQRCLSDLQPEGPAEAAARVRIEIDAVGTLIADETKLRAFARLWCDYHQHNVVAQLDGVSVCARMASQHVVQLEQVMAAHHGSDEVRVSIDGQDASTSIAAWNTFVHSISSS